MIAAAETFFFPFKSLPTEIISHILLYVQDQIEHQVDPFLILNLDSRLRRIATSNPSLWTKITWSPSWRPSPPPEQGSKAATLDFVRQKDSIRPQAVLKLYAKYSKDTMHHVDFSEAPHFSDKVAREQIVPILEASKDTFRLLRIQPSYKCRKASSEGTKIEQGSSVLAMCIFNLACNAPRLEDVYVHVHWWPPSEEQTVPQSTLTGVPVPPSRRRPLRNLRLQLVRDEVETSDQGDLSPSLVSLMTGLEALTVEGTVECDYVGSITKAAPTLRFFDFKSLSTSFNIAPLDPISRIHFPHLEKLRLEYLPDGPLAVPVNWELPTCRELEMPWESLPTVKAVNCHHLILIVASWAPHTQRLGYFRALKQFPCKAATFKFPFSGPSDLNYGGALSKRSQSILSRPLVEAIVLVGESTVLNRIDELNFVAPPVAAAAYPDLSFNFASRPRLKSSHPHRYPPEDSLPTREFYEGCYPCIDNIATLLFASDGRSAGEISLKRINIENIRIPLASYEQLLKRCTQSNIALRVWPNPRAMDLMPYAKKETTTSSSPPT
ncbi:unnamed protein product [Sympodiomycopsis kandeliae]